jgi:hypothetical protein
VHAAVHSSLPLYAQNPLYVQAPAVLGQFERTYVGHRGIHPKVQATRRIARLVRERLIEPAFNAPSRQDYWRIRDEIFSRPSEVRDLFSKLSKAVKAVPSNLRPPPVVTGEERVLRSPPAFLSAASLAELREGFELQKRIEIALNEDWLHRDSDSKTERLDTEGVSEERALIRQSVDRAFATHFVLRLWADFLARGSKPACADVSASIAKNFSNGMASFLGFLQSLRDEVAQGVDAT